MSFGDIKPSRTFFLPKHIHTHLPRSTDNKTNETGA